MSAPRTEILFSGSRGTAESVRLAVGQLCGCAVGGRRRANAVTHRTTFSNQFCDKCLLFPLLARLVLQTNVFENVLLLFSCVDLYYGVNIYTRQNFCHSFDAGCLAFPPNETQCKRCRFLLFVYRVSLTFVQLPGIIDAVGNRSRLCTESDPNRFVDSSIQSA